MHMFYRKQCCMENMLYGKQCRSSSAGLNWIYTIFNRVYIWFNSAFKRVYIWFQNSNGYLKLGSLCIKYSLGQEILSLDKYILVVLILAPGVV